MKKLMQAFRIKSILLPSVSQNYHSSPSESLISWIAAYSTISQKKKAICPKPNMENSLLANYLIGSLKFSKDRALLVSSKFSHIKTLEKPEQAVCFFRGLGFSDAHIRAIAHSLPQVLFADTENTLKPKVEYFQELGLSGPRLGSFISRTPCILYCSVDRCLKPRIDLIRKVFASDGRNRSVESVNDDLFRTITRCGRIVFVRHAFKANILYLKSCGVVGSQLSTLLLNRSRLFALPREKVEELVSRAVDMNFDMGSRMLVHAITVLSCVSLKTLDGRFGMFRRFGFDKGDLASMFRKSPHTFALSEVHLGRKLEFFLNELKIDRVVIVGCPIILCLSLEERIIPRCNVLEVLKSRGLLRRDLGLQHAMCISDKKFCEK